jgi:hypothetical protein
MIYLFLVPLADKSSRAGNPTLTSDIKGKKRGKVMDKWNKLQDEQDSKAQFEYISYASALAASPLSAPKTPN